MHFSRATSLLAACFSMAAFAQNAPDRGTNDPHRYSDGSWVGITGQVESTSPGSFILDYGDGNIKVELEPSSTNKHDFLKNEQVRVFGVVDAGFFKGRTIKAHAVYVESMKGYVCTTDGAETTCSSFAPAIFSGVVVHGLVTKVGAHTLQVDEGDRLIEVDTSNLNQASGDRSTGQAAQVGDLVTVLGHMDEGLFSRKLKASSVEID